MSAFDEKKISKIVIINCRILLGLAVFHFISLFFIGEPNFNNILDNYKLSPLFDFETNTKCIITGLTLHKWGGIKKYEKEYRSGDNGLPEEYEVTTIENEVDIKKINGVYFCYKNKRYIDLLNNGQIIKKGENCPNEYPNNCGTIDTLLQELCIENGQNCPLYDIGIGNNPNNNYYNYDSQANIYYNNNNYKGNKIIGKLILNEGQPCIYIKEKLWRKFLGDEADDGDLQCHLEVNGKTIDERYAYKGDITYRRLYEDNFPSFLKELILKKVKNEKVSLYYREFLGIDKECNKRSSLDNIEEFMNCPEREKRIALIEIIIAMISLFAIFILSLVKCCKEVSCTFFIILLIPGLVIFLIGFILHYVVLMKMIKYKVHYDYCSDDFTNELIKIENEKVEKSILFSFINMGFDALIILLNLILAIIYLIIYLKGSCSNTNYTSNESKKPKSFDDKNSNNSKQIMNNNIHPLDQYFNRMNGTTD